MFAEGLVYLYECMCVLRHSFKPDNFDWFLDRLGSSLNSGGGWGGVMARNVIGVLQFAYPIKKKRRGLYVLFYFKADGSVIKDLKRKLTYDDEVLRHLVLRVDSIPDPIPTITGVEVQQQ